MEKQEIKYFCELSKNISCLMVYIWNEKEPMDAKEWIGKSLVSNVILVQYKCDDGNLKINLSKKDS